MGRSKKKDGSNLKPEICKGVTLREENSGKKEIDISSVLKIKHLQNLAAWASGEGGIPCLAAHFGRQLAVNAEALGVPLDESYIFCQRCESLLRPGFNCTVRIVKCEDKKRKRSKNTSTFFQNNIIYKCNFCHHPNSINGTPKGHIKNLLSSRESRLDIPSGSNLHCSLNEATAEEVHTDDRKPILSQLNVFSSPTNDSIARDIFDQKAPRTPLHKSAILSKNESELESEKHLVSSNSAELSDSSKGSTRRKKRKTWSTLKDIVEKNERNETESSQNLLTRKSLRF